MNLLRHPKDGPEISDLIASFDPDSLARLPVDKQKVIEKFLSIGNHQAARIVERMPDQGGVLDEQAVDDLLISAHCEMQRISEEFQHGQRVLELLKPVLAALDQRGNDANRVVDIGCGSGYIIRWLADRAHLGDGVHLTGADLNAALIGEARRLAEIEKLRCSFVIANAFNLRDPATVYLSTGVLHHFRDEGLVEFFRQQDTTETAAFLHFDFQPSFFAPFGSWLFHEIRMRQPMAKHDGVLSSLRVYTGRELVEAARRGAPGMTTAIYSARLWGLPIPRVFHTLIGIRPKLWDAFVEALGKRAGRLETR